VVEYNAIDRLVQRKYGFKNYEYTYVEECSNDCSQTYTACKELDEDELEDIAKWEAGEFVHYSNYAIINMLCRDGFLPEGNILVQVSW
jgi:hypothetical protein